MFFQYKRPEFIDHHRGKEWPCWKGPYFRFDITPHQQVLLAGLESQSAGRAVVVYASAAFWQNDELYLHAKDEMVIANSNIANVARLNGHGRFSYNGPGSFGRGHSEPVDIESVSLIQIIEGGLQQEELPFDQHIKGSSRTIEELIKPDEPQTQVLDKVRRLLLGDDVDTGTEVPRDSFSYALATVVAFCELADVSLYAMG
jgi:hypothetical protein